MSERSLAGRTWAGRLRETALITPEQDLELVCGVVREAIFFVIEDEHPELADWINQAVGLCHDSVRGGGMAVYFLNPAFLTAFERDHWVEDMLLIARMAGTLVAMIELGYGHFRTQSHQEAQARLDRERATQGFDLG